MTTTYDTTRYDLVELGNVKPGDLVRLPQVVINARAESWQVGALTVMRVERKASGVYFIYPAPQPGRVWHIPFLMVCGERLRSGVLRDKAPRVSLTKSYR